MLTQEFLNDLFVVKDGCLIRRKSVSQNTKPGDKAGTVSKDGYIRVFIQGKSYLAHRVVFLMEHGYMPNEIDHINGNKTDNSPRNLREATRAQNGRNKQFISSTGCKNVVFVPKKNRYEVRIGIGGKTKYIGSSKDLELAELIAIEAREKYHGAFANHGVA